MATTGSVRSWPAERTTLLPAVRANAVEFAAAALLLGVAVMLRLVNLGVYSGLFDEGIRVEQLFLM